MKRFTPALIASLLFFGACGPDDSNNQENNQASNNMTANNAEENAAQNMEPGNMEPGNQEPGNQEPGNMEPGNQEPGNQDPGNMEPGNQEPGNMEPGNMEPGNMEPGNQEPGNMEPGNMEPGNTGNGEPGNFGTAEEAQTFFEAFVAAQSEAFCRVAWECPESQPFISLFAHRFPTQAECEAGFMQTLKIGTNLIEPTKAAVDAGTAKFDKDKAAECLVYIDNITSSQDACTIFKDFETSDSAANPCEVLLIGSIDDGQACASSAECVGVDSECVKTEQADGMCTGVCEAPAVACGGSCADTQYCDTSTDTCAELKQQGEDCSKVTECSGDLICDVDGVCNPVQQGQAAMMGQPCSVFGGPTGPTLCTPGLACRDYVVDQMQGTVSGTCQPPGQEMDDCSLDFECGVGLRCLGASFPTTLGKCAPLSTDGQSCEENFHCAGDLVCGITGDDEDGVCRVANSCDTE